MTERERPEGGSGGEARGVGGTKSAGSGGWGVGDDGVRLKERKWIQTKGSSYASTLNGNDARRAQERFCACACATLFLDALMPLTLLCLFPLHDARIRPPLTPKAMPAIREVGERGNRERL